MWVFAIVGSQDRLRDLKALPDYKANSLGKKIGRISGRVHSHKHVLQVAYQNAGEQGSAANTKSLLFRASWKGRAIRSNEIFLGAVDWASFRMATTPFLAALAVASSGLCVGPATCISGHQLGHFDALGSLA